MRISPIGTPIHGNFYSVSGTNIPSNVTLVFTTDKGTVSVTPDLERPHLIFVNQLPNTIPVGRNILTLQTSSWRSDAVAVRVSANNFAQKRIIYPGAQKDRPYTIAFVANPAIESSTGGIFTADPILANQPSYHAVVGYCIRNLLSVTEDVLRADNIDAQIRFVSIFDPLLSVGEDSALVREVPASNLMETRRQVLAPFLSRYQEIVDVVFVIHGSTTHTRATAWFTTDYEGSAGTSFIFDGVSKKHGYFPRIPGSAAIPASVDVNALTAIHEFGHAASDFNNGRVTDLYVDGIANGFDVNKKFRSTSGGSIPTNFATYNGIVYESDPSRDGIAYEPNWLSYHPSLIDSSKPNMMDNYYFATSPQQCRLDKLTYVWFRDRLKAKIFR